MITKVVYAIGGKLGKVEVGKEDCDVISIEDGLIHVYDREAALILTIKAAEYEAYYTQTK